MREATPILLGLGEHCRVVGAKGSGEPQGQTRHHLYYSFWSKPYPGAGKSSMLTATQAQEGSHLSLA